MNNEKKPDTQKAESEKSVYIGFVWLCTGVAALWACCTLVIYLLLPDWQARGTVGDSFGAVNALFSGLAFAGVIYALNLQRRELTYQREEMLATRAVSEAQLAEMKISRELLAQPLPIPKITALKIERPRFYYSPPEDEHSVQSRYFVHADLSNPTQYPAVGLSLSCSIQVGVPRKALGWSDSYMSILAPGAALNDPSEMQDFLFNGDTTGRLFDSLRQNDPRQLPAILVVIHFKNVVGAHFRLVQAFRVLASHSHIETLRAWHTAVVGSDTRFKQQLITLKELKRKNRDKEWDVLFESVKSEFSESVPKEEFLLVGAEIIPASFSLVQISEDDYDVALKNSAYPRRMNDMYDCPAELDGRH
ncbi:hypothetical protein [Pseudomonas sp. Leaf434]|uniref:hypothetical protein n=1 Tax=Pseudomonas sp. Leaf434 TaxID=1736376 RepID=UPI000A570AFA|nr:hypothetical protein [Pseudomonas sp. Leaf434]